MVLGSQLQTALHTSTICPIELKIDFLGHILKTLVDLRNTMSFDLVHRSLRGVRSRLDLHTVKKSALVTEIWRFEVWCFLSFFVKPGPSALVFSLLFRFISSQPSNDV